MTVRSVLGRGIGRSPRGMTRRVGVVAFAAVAVAACGSGTTSPTSSGTTGSDLLNPANFDTQTVSWLAANQNASGAPVMGGTLKVEGSTDLSAAGDPQGEYETIAYTLERAYTRQLVSYPASSDLTKAE